MKRVGGIGLTIALVVGVLVFAAPGAAQAAPGDGCGFTSVTDPLGGDDDWRGVIDLHYVPPVGQSATVSCEFYVDGVSQGIKLGPVSGTGVIVAAGPFTYTAGRDQRIRMCMHIAVAGVPQPDICFEMRDPDPIPPDEVVELIDDVIGLANTVVVLFDPALCSALRAAAPTVNGLNRPTVLRINPTYGDVYLLDSLFWDCPPYGSG